jgi:hypothetical protein
MVDFDLTEQTAALVLIAAKPRHGVAAAFQET